MKEMCANCYGTGNVPCEHCGGTGVMPNVSLLGEACQKCKGTRTERCQLCHGTGFLADEVIAPEPIGVRALSDAAS
jgi:hypothetical protein